MRGLKWLAAPRAGEDGPEGSHERARADLQRARVSKRKLQARTKPQGPAIYTPWVEPGVLHPTCWVRLCWVPARTLQYRLLYCPFATRFFRLLELPPWIPLTAGGPRPGGWEDAGKLPPACEWQFRTYPPPPQPGVPNGPPPNVPAPGGFPIPPWGPWGGGLSVVNSDDGTTFYPAADFPSSFFDVFVDLSPATGNPNPPVQFAEYLADLGPRYGQAAGALTPLIVELQQVIQAEPNVQLELIQLDLIGMRSSMFQISQMFNAGVVNNPAPFQQMSAALSDMAVRMPNLLPSPNRFENAADNLLSMAQGFNVAAQMVAGGLNKPTEQDLFRWGLINRFQPMLADLATGTLPHIRVSVELGDWVWFPSTIDGIHVQVYEQQTQQLIEEFVTALSDLSQFDVVYFGGQVPLRIWFKLPTYLGRAIEVIPSDGLSVGPFAMIAGDADGDDCVDAADLQIVTMDQGQGGEHAQSVPASDVNGDGVVDQLDLNIVVANQGQCGQSPLCPWDCGNGDGNTGVVDFLALLSQWGQSGTTCDFNGTGVGVVQFLALLAHWGPC